LIETLLHKFYAASISIDSNGGMLVASTDERLLAWAMLFCFATALSLLAGLIWKHRQARMAAATGLLACLLLTALILPSVRQEYIHVSPAVLTIETGSWYRPSRTVIDMADIDNIRESDPQGILPSNLIGDPVIHWHVTRTNGSREVLELNDFFSAHRMVVAYYYKDRGFWLERLEDRQRVLND
jgi:hypothetical protein